MPATRPEDTPATFETAFNTGLVPQPGQVVHGTDAIRQALLGFLALKLSIHLESKRVLVNGDVALVSSTWKLAGTGPDDSPVDLGGNTTEVVRRQPGPRRAPCCRAAGGRRGRGRLPIVPRYSPD